MLAQAPEPRASASATSSATEDLPACVAIRDTPGVLHMIELRTAAGESWAFPYSYLIFARYDKEAITLRFSSHSVSVRGRMLGAVFSAILQHRVESIRAEDERFDMGPESDPFVFEVEVKARE